MKKLKHILRRIVTFKNWYGIIWPFSRIGFPQRTLKLRNGTAITVRDIHSSDMNILYQMLETLPQYGKLPERGVIVDIGAHIGIFSVLAAQETRAKIIAVEPIAENYELLKKNTSQKDFWKRIVPYKIAIAGKNETREISLYSKNTGGHKFSSYQNNDFPREKVRCVTLDEFLKNETSVDFLKCDVEGAEYEIFFNAAPETFAKIRRMVIECHKGGAGDEPQNLVNLLKKYGYSITTGNYGIYGMIFATK